MLAQPPITVAPAYHRHRPEQTAFYAIVANLNPHLHMLFLDGAYTFNSGKVSFHHAPLPHPDDLANLLDTLSRRIVRLLERRGLLIAEPQRPALNLDVGSALDQIQAASLQYRIAVGPHAGRKALTLYSVPPLEDYPHSSLLAQVAGFSLHAATVCEAHQRSKLERLCRYITRPPIATKRLSVDRRGRVVYQYKRPFRQRRKALLNRVARAPPDSQQTSIPI